MLAGKLSQLGLDLDGEKMTIDSIGLVLSNEVITETAATIALNPKVVCHWIVTNAVHASAATLTLAVAGNGAVAIVGVKTKGTHSAILTPAVLGPTGTAITFDAVGEMAVLVCDGTSWQIVGTYGSPSVA